MGEQPGGAVRGEEVGDVDPASCKAAASSAGLSANQASPDPLGPAAAAAAGEAGALPFICRPS
jgi:hypothetical protein